MIEITVRDYGSKMARRKITKVGGSATAAQTSKRPTQSESKESGSKRRLRPGTKALQEIRKYQRSTDLLLRRLPFARVVYFTFNNDWIFIIFQVKEISDMYIGVDGVPKRWKVDALMALQYAAETYLTNIFADA